MAKEFWDSGVHRRAKFYLTKVKSRAQSADDGTAIGRAAREWSPDSAPPLKRLKVPRGPAPSGGKARGSGRGKQAPGASDVCQRFLIGQRSDPRPWGRLYVAPAQPKPAATPGKGKGGKKIGKGGKPPWAKRSGK